MRISTERMVRISGDENNRLNKPMKLETSAVLRTVGSQDHTVPVCYCQMRGPKLCHQRLVIGDEVDQTLRQNSSQGHR